MIDFNVGPPQVSPLREAPEPRHPGQVAMFSDPVVTAVAPDQKMQMRLTIGLNRHPRQKCASCGNRRVCFSVGLSDVISSPRLCARCAGIR
jgi:hypothetical protein